MYRYDRTDQQLIDERVSQYRDQMARHLAGELTLSFVPDAEQRLMRTLMRRRAQLTRDRVRIQNQVESLLSFD